MLHSCKNLLISGSNLASVVYSYINYILTDFPKPMKKMVEKRDKNREQSKPCPGCGGSGQTSFFAGESRFMFTIEDCPDCCGTGIDLNDSENADPPDNTLNR
jgi:hypothetical protein